MSLKEYFAWLDSVRESGVINMFAAPKALQENFGLSKEEAMEIFVAWTETYK
jgi:hypothetical protein